MCEDIGNIRLASNALFRKSELGKDYQFGVYKSLKYYNRYI